MTRSRSIRSTAAQAPATPETIGAQPAAADTGQTSPPSRARRPAARQAAPAPLVEPVAVPALAAAEEEAAAEVPAKVKKIKLIRDSYAMPSDEYAQLALLKQRALTADVSIKKGDLLRAGLLVLSSMTERNFLAALNKLPLATPKKKSGKKG